MAKKTTIGGQALIEGIMMKGPSKLAMAVRKQDGEIAIKVVNIEDKFKRQNWMNLPIIRGSTALVESMKIGMEAILYSASFFEEESEPSWLSKKFGEKGEKFGEILMVLFSTALAVGLFMILPTLIVSWLAPLGTTSFAKNLIEGLIRLIIFFMYVGGISMLNDMKRLFSYHGAEHKTISCYENGCDLTVEEVRKYSALHPRCGTSFLFMVMLVSIVVLSFFGWPHPLLRFIIRIAMLPVIAGITYEINRWIGRSDNPIICKLAYPGMMVQRFATVREPDDSMIEVAIASLKAVLPEEGESDEW
ncbi:MAG: DUF1385 domain-containing protein [Tissierellia bacterium]|nr:DUF1385 domain-containing protein [Tissierellia bacterium]